MKGNECTMHPSRKSSNRNKPLEVKSNAIYGNVRANLDSKHMLEHWQYNGVTDWFCLMLSTTQIANSIKGSPGTTNTNGGGCCISGLQSATQFNVSCRISVRTDTRSSKLHKSSNKWAEAAANNEQLTSGSTMQANSRNLSTTEHSSVHMHRPVPTKSYHSRQPQSKPGRILHVTDQCEHCKVMLRGVIQIIDFWQF